MARADGRRGVSVWLSEQEWALAEMAAEQAGVATGALLREAALWNLAAVAREVSAGRVRLRARSLRVPVPVAAAETSREGIEAWRAEKAAARVEDAAASGMTGKSPVSSSSRPASAKLPESETLQRCDVVRGGEVVGECVAPVDAAGYPVVDRAEMFRRMTQR